MAKAFAGKDTKAEERAEARAVRSGKLSPSEYAAKERREEKMEGESGKSMSSLKSTGKALATGSMSPSQYASRGMADGGMVGCSAPNERLGNQGPGVRSYQDYRK